MFEKTTTLSCLLKLYHYIYRRFREYLEHVLVLIPVEVVKNWYSLSLFTCFFLNALTNHAFSSERSCLKRLLQTGHTNTLELLDWHPKNIVFI